MAEILRGTDGEEEGATSESSSSVMESSENEA